MTSRPTSETIREALDAIDAAEALRQRHERIGRMVCENLLVLGNVRDYWPGGLAAAGPETRPGLIALEAILAEVES